MSQVQRLDSVAEITMGQAPAGESYNADGNGMPLIAGAGDFGEVHPAPKKYTTAPGKTCQAGDIILGIRATIGKKVLADRQHCLGRGVAGLRARPGLDGRYLWHWLTHAAPGLATKAKGATFKQVNREDIGALHIPVPPVPEQKRIAEILDKADALRAKRRAALAKLDTLTQSIFLDMFGDPAKNPKGWPVRTIRDLLESARYGTSEKAAATGEFPVLRMKNITRTGEMVFAELKYMELKEDERERYLVRTGDVLFNRTNSAELVGKTAIYREANPMAYAGYLIRLRVNREYEPEYLAAFLNTVYSKRVLRSMCKSIIGMANINATELQALRIPVPPHLVQHEFAGCITAVEKLKATHRISLVKQDDLFSTLQQRAFRGDL